jgi:hypothetical protein
MLLMIIGGISLLALPSVLSRIGTRLRAQQWAVICCLALVGGLTLTFGSVLLIVAPQILGALGLARSARACEQMLGGYFPRGPIASIIADVLGLSGVTFATLAVLRSQKSARDISLGLKLSQPIDKQGSVTFVVLPHEQSFAVSMPSGRKNGTVMISQGLVDTLSEPQYDLVCAHEVAHLRYSHHRYLLLALLVDKAFWYFPPARMSAQTLRVALECWADEVAAGPSVKSRRTLRSALLAVATTPPTFSALAAFSGVDNLMQRLSALERDPEVHDSWWWFALLVPEILIGLVAIFGASRIGHQVVCLISMPNQCPQR